MIRVTIVGVVPKVYRRVTVWLDGNMDLVAVFVVVAFLFWAAAVLLGYLPPHPNWTTN